MRHGGPTAIAVSLASRFLFFSSSSTAPAADEVGKILLIASICKAFRAAGGVAVVPPVDPADVDDAVVLHILRQSSLRPRAKADFLRWRISLPGYTPSAAAFSELLRSHCRCGLLDDLRPIIRLAASSSASVDPCALKLVLDLLIRSGRVDAAIDVLDDLESLGGGVSLNPRVYNAVVVALIRKSQVDLALSMFWKLLESHSEVERLTCNELLLALRREGMRDEYVKAFDVLSQRGFRFDTKGFNICIHAFGYWGRLDVALKLFKEMKEKGQPEAVADICTYNSLLHGLCFAGRLEDALSVYEELKGSGHEPDRFTYQTLIHGCCKVYRVEDAMRIFTEAEHSTVTVGTLAYNSLLNGLLKGRKLSDACQLFERMVSEGVRASSYTYNILIDGLCRNGRSAAAFSLFCDLKKKGQFVDAVTYSTVVMQLCREGQVDRALELVEEMETRGFAVDLLTVTALLVGLHRCGRWDWASRLMKHVRDSNLVPTVLRWTTAMETSMRQHQSHRADYTPLFPAAGEFIDVLSWANPAPEEDSREILSGDGWNDEWSSSPTMDRLARRSETFATFSGFTVRRGRRVQQRGSKSLDMDMVNTYMSIFLAEGRLSAACKLFEIFTEMGRDPVIYTYNSLMGSFIKKGYFNAAWGLLQEMGDRLCPADIATYNLILQGLGRIGRADLATSVLERLKKKGGFLDVVMYNTLIHALGRAGRMEEVNQLLKKMTGDGVNPDIVTFNTLIEVHTKAGRVRDAYKFLRMMLDAGCSPNHITDTILDLLEKEIERTRSQKASTKQGKDGDE